MIYYVVQENTAAGDGSRENPFRSIGQAAEVAAPGDTVLIGDGVYREWVSPQNGGICDEQRITYKAADGANPVISGAEIISGWEPYKNNVWRAEVENTLFGDYNPYTDEIFGDWYDCMGQVHHTGEVFADGNAMYETASLEDIFKAPKDKKKIPRWYAVPEKDKMVFYGDFDGKNPNDLVTEISVRPFCFFPQKEGINYITVSGLTLRQAATQWAPPTAFQPGLIGPHWSCGWIIENCKIHDSKCCGISLGKKRDLKDNCWSKNPAKGGTQTYTEMVFSNLQDGWDKENIGGHIVRNNEIYNCGQTGIVGCMGGAFSDIVGNHIHHINIRHEFSGAETAGIKLHAAIDVVLEKNVIHDCNRGIWLDWEAQGAAVRKNALFRNDDTEDLFIEVCHGPVLVENNLLLSKNSFLNVSQGTALVHNLFAGKLRVLHDTNRFTLYHLPHLTAVGGVMLIYGGDDRILNNIFIGADSAKRFLSRLFVDKTAKNHTYGTACYKGYRHTAAKKTMKSDTAAADIGKTLPTVMRNNLYLNGAKHWAHEQNPRVISDFYAKLTVQQENGHYYLYTNLGDLTADCLFSERITTGILGASFESEQAFENRDGSPVSIDSDFENRPRGETTKIGPFETDCQKILLV
ncbi:MAG: right-handed parallel beta-helix repeat-containing protein [Candidatus Fimenecus sp.]